MALNIAQAGIAATTTEWTGANSATGRDRKTGVTVT